MSKCEHQWHWYRRRSADYGRWVCLACKKTLEPIPLDNEGHPAQTPDEALRTRRWWRLGRG